MNAIHCGDQYSIPFRITDCKGRSLTEDIVTDVVIKIGSIVKSYEKHSISYDSENDVWLFPITDKETKELYKLSRTFGADETIPLQVKVKVGNDIILNDVVDFEVKKSIIGLLE